MWRTGRPAWIADAAEHPRPLPRAQAADAAGLRSAFAFPIRCAGNVLGVMEFFAAARMAPDDELLATMSQPRARRSGSSSSAAAPSRASARATRARRAILNAAFDCIITMDGDGHIVEVNAATETTFGYAAEEMVGRELAELMIPPGSCARTTAAACGATWRPARRGSSATRSSSRRCARTAASSRSSWPSRGPTCPGPPLFCGYLRDVTERRRAEQAAPGLAEEQAALRRVATAVAAEVEPERLFGLVAEEVGRALDAGIGEHPALQRRRHRARHGRVERRAPTTIPVGTTLVLDGDTDRAADLAHPRARRASTRSTA